MSLQTRWPLNKVVDSHQQQLSLFQSCLSCMATYTNSSKLTVNSSPSAFFPPKQAQIALESQLLVFSKHVHKPLALSGRGSWAEKWGSGVTEGALKTTWTHPEDLIREKGFQPPATFSPHTQADSINICKMGKRPLIINQWLVSN